jgi:outer membrane phospholipase A
MLLPISLMAEPLTNQPSAGGGEEGQGLYPGSVSDNGLYGSYLDNIYRDQPFTRATYYRLNYAVVGPDDGKMQVSLKYRVVRDFNLYLGINTLLLWDVYADSNPLRDFVFNPEILYRFTSSSRWLLSVDAGYFHASNGKAAAESRSWDRLLLRFNSHSNSAPIDIIWVTSFYVDLRKGHNNGDIYNYSGFWDTMFILRKLLGERCENLDLDVRVVSGRSGEPFNKGSFAVGAKYNLPGERFNPYLYLEYFNGYAETLLDYRKRNEELRGGFAFYY